MAAIQYIFDSVIQLYILVIFVSVILSWLLSFNVINLGNPMVESIWRATNALTEPALRRIRNLLPNLGGLDLSPIVLLIGLRAAQIFVNDYVFRPLRAAGL